jgi:hypothetical protein
MIHRPRIILAAHGGCARRAEPCANADTTGKYVPVAFLGYAGRCLILWGSGSFWSCTELVIKSGCRLALFEDERPMICSSIASVNAGELCRLRLLLCVTLMVWYRYLLQHCWHQSLDWWLRGYPREQLQVGAAGRNCELLLPFHLVLKPKATRLNRSQEYLCWVWAAHFLICRFL